MSTMRRYQNPFLAVNPEGVGRLPQLPQLVACCPNCQEPLQSERCPNMTCWAFDLLQPAPEMIGEDALAKLRRAKTALEEANQLAARGAELEERNDRALKIVATCVATLVALWVVALVAAWVLL